MSTQISTSDIQTKASTEALMDRIAAAGSTERDEIRTGLESLTVRPGIKSGQQGRIRAALAYLETRR